MFSFFSFVKNKVGYPRLLRRFSGQRNWRVELSSCHHPSEHSKTHIRRHRYPFLFLSFLPLAQRVVSLGEWCLFSALRGYQGPESVTS